MPLDNKSSKSCSIIDQIAEDKSCSVTPRKKVNFIDESDGKGASNPVMITHLYDVYCEDIDEQRSYWKKIAYYAPVKHMQMALLRGKFGKDSSDPNGWMCMIELFAFVDDLLLEVKDIYQQMTDEEQSKRAVIMSEHQKHR